MSNEISNERLAVIAACGRESIFPVTPRDCSAMAKELLSLRKAFSVPDYWEIAGQIFATEEEALSYGFTGKPEPLYSKPEA
ncbi:hypothetical protein EGJ48_03700 [Pantoea dispersa]|uniref:hypothetical protein n=1 Tax=Pantoea dispersa TaxID=59814 RepID=UPI000F667D47|nr:hypothetical protein [Pantoea dispersa]RRW77661.1 hypothetical protein EGJ48_03700 [Pantoea dispersa]